MNTNKKKLRIVLWTSVLSSLAMAVATPWSGAQPMSSRGAAGQEKAARKTTDPPVPSHGKLGQELFLAIDHRDVTGVESLIKKGADPNSKNGLEFRPLFIAAASHQPDVMKALLDAGAKPDVRSSYGTALTFAAATANLEGAKMLLDRGVDVNVSRGDGITPLIMASYSGSPEFVGELIKHKANVNAKNGSNAAPLNYAARQGHVEVGRLLIEAGAKVDNADVEGQTPLMSAAMTGHPDFVRMLLEHGAKPNLRDAKKRTALMLAASYGDYPEVVKALKEGGADVKATDPKGRTAATLAASHGYRESASLLGAKSSNATTKKVRQSLVLSLKMLESSTSEFERNTACLSCHQEGLGRMATAAAGDHGLRTDGGLHKSQSARVNGALSAMLPLHTAALKSPEAMKQVPLIEMNEVTSGYAWLLAGKVAQHEPATPGSAAMVEVMARQQSPDGHWSFSLPRVPMQSSFFTYTALAVRSLTAYAPKSAALDTAARMRKAKSWLMSAPAQTGDDRAFRLLGLQWSGATAAEKSKAMAEILANQNPDGGWSQVKGLASDAYATGQALYALHVGGGMAVTAPVYKQGVQFLLRTQDDDGTWFVNKRALPANNYFDAGFPHGESQYSSFNGTCWATMALLETLSGK